MSNYTHEKIKPKMSKEERDKMMKKFLDKGGKIQKLKPGSAAVLGSLDKSKKPAFTSDEIKRGVKGHAPAPDYKTYKPNTYHDYDVGGDKPPVWERQPKNEMGGK